jgi:hypothetical protein
MSTARLLLLTVLLPGCLTTTTRRTTTEECDGDEECVTEDTGTVAKDTATSACRVSHSASSCSACKADEYCEPGSSAAGVWCLPYCTTTSDCNCGGNTLINCLPNNWTSSYKGTVCRTGK